MKKKIIIGILIAALVAGGSAGGAVYYKKSHQKTVSVVSVDSLAGQYYIQKKIDSVIFFTLRYQSCFHSILHKFRDAFA